MRLEKLPIVSWVCLGSILLRISAGTVALRCNRISRSKKLVLRQAVAGSATVVERQENFMSHAASVTGVEIDPTWLVAYGPGGAGSGYPYASIIVAKNKAEARVMVDTHWASKDAILKHWAQVLGAQGNYDAQAAAMDSTPATAKVKSSQAAANDYLVSEYESYVSDVAEGAPMQLDDWLAGSDIPEIVRARNVSRGIQCIGKIWQCADNMTEAKQWESDLLAKGAIKVELKPEDDRPIVDVIVTLDCCKANEILGYDVESHEWMEEDPESESAAQVQGVDDSAIQAERPRER